MRDHRHKPQGLGSNRWPSYPWKNQSAPPEVRPPPFKYIDEAGRLYFCWLTVCRRLECAFSSCSAVKASPPTAWGSVHPEPFPTMFTMSLGSLCHLLTSPWLRLIITSSQFPYSSDPNQIFFFFFFGLPQSSVTNTISRVLIRSQIYGRSPRSAYLETRPRIFR